MLKKDLFCRRLDMEQISVLEAAQRKGCTRQAINDAIRAGRIDAVKIGKVHIVLVTSRFEAWTPMSGRQKAGRARWASTKKKVRK